MENIVLAAWVKNEKGWGENIEEGAIGDNATKKLDKTPGHRSFWLIVKNRGGGGIIEIHYIYPWLILRFQGN